MSNCILVLGVPRSGTSLVAGILHKLGVSMGNSLNHPQPGNEKGFFEDKEFMGQHAGGGNVEHWQRVIETGHQPLPDRYPEFIKARQTQPVWGLKDSTVVHTVRHFYDLATPVKLVWVVRRPQAVVASMLAFPYNLFKKDEAVAWRSYWEWAGLVHDALAEGMARGFPLYVARFEVILADPEGEVAALAAFAGVPVTSEAVSHVDPGMDHHGMVV